MRGDNNDNINHINPLKQKKEGELRRIVED
jgi:hypothetical protein